MDGWPSRHRRCASKRRGLHAAALGRVLGIVTWVGLCATPAALALTAATDDEASSAASTAASPSKIRSDEDGWLDLSEFLDQSYGFVPLLIPITEPAVGYGAAGGLVFIDRPPGETRPGLDRPNLTMVGGLATANGTWGLLAGDVRHWRDDRVQTLAGLIYASVNLDFYGIGEDDALEDHPLSYNLEPLGGAVRAKYRFGESRVWGGLAYALADTKISSDESSMLPGLADLPADSQVGGLIPSLTYDSRDNIFTPTGGTYFEGSVGVFHPALGGDDRFQRVNLTLLTYALLHPRLTLGVRGGATFSFEDVPFYLLPYITLRGAPVLRYQGEETAEIETELRWQFWERFSVVGFAGTGGAWNDFERVDDLVTVVTGGTGFRYELARKYGLHAGLDVAFGPDGPAIYVQFGSAWMRP